MDLYLLLNNITSILWNMDLYLLLNNITAVHFIDISQMRMKSLACLIVFKYPHIQVSGITDLVNFTMKGIEINGDLSHLHSKTALIIYSSCLSAEYTNLLNNFKNNGYKCSHRSEITRLIFQPYYN